MRGIQGLGLPVLPWQVRADGTSLEGIVLLNPENGMSLQVLIDLRDDAHRRAHPDQTRDFRLPPELILRPHVETAALAIWAPCSAARLQERQKAFPTDHIDGYRLQVGADGRVRLEDAERGRLDLPELDMGSVGMDRAGHWECPRAAGPPPFLADPGPSGNPPSVLPAPPHRPYSGGRGSGV
ncbi:hypothetical protein [Thermoflexus sp.]|uniref:hypothetical protein n=1 Tax=Thermoflexus sp. TaxID=1969742 RepID=UPI0017FF046A|nr:hypothetical protein [Thermoflexus sp.]